MGRSIFLLFVVVFGQKVESAESLGLIRPPAATDLNPDPDVVEVELVAREDTVLFDTGNMTEVYTYNGRIPGPTIEGKVGDLLIVHFTNLLPEETTIHWHGLDENIEPARAPTEVGSGQGDPD